MSDSESGAIRAKSSGFLNKLHLFKTFFVMQLLLKLFFPLEQIKISLQCKSRSLYEAQAMIALLKVSLASYREKFADL